jgi:hypothetical protein
MIFGRASKRYLRERRIRQAGGNPLDVQPESVDEALDELTRLVGIFERAELPRAAHRLRVLVGYLRRTIKGEPVAAPSE